MGVPYEIKYVDIGKGDQFEKGFLKISPNNKMPAIVDYDGPEGEVVSVLSRGRYCSIWGGNMRGFIRRTRGGEWWLISGCFGKWGAGSDGGAGASFSAVC